MHLTSLVQASSYLLLIVVVLIVKDGYVVNWQLFHLAFEKIRLVYYHSSIGPKPHSLTM